MAEDVFGIVGSVIAGAYHVEAVVAEGGFGVVYRAHHGGFRAPVALKLLKIPPQSSEQQHAFLELFRAEAELSFRLSASLPTVVRPLHVDAFTAADGSFVPYIVLEWLEGVTLDALIKQRNRQGLPPLSLRKLVRLLTPVARALERAHHFNGPDGVVSIVHRDLKPENIFVAQVAGEEVVKILDFGIGKVKSVASQVAGRASQDGQAPTAFTPAYGAPEQWAPKHFGQTGPWTDVWGLAVCMVEALAARPVIDGDPQAMMGTTLDPNRRPTPRTEGVEVSDAVEAVFARALALDPRARQRDAGLFWNELLSAMQIPESEYGVALPRDGRAEAGGGIRLERVEVRSRPSGSLSRVPQPSPAVERALAMDLEFDPTSKPARLGSVSGTRPSTPAPSRAAAQPGHWVPDLELAPPPASRRAAEARPASSVSGAGHRAVTQPDAHTSGAHPALLDFDDVSGTSASLDLDLDLPADEPISRRAVSSPGMRAVSAPEMRAASTPGMPAVQAPTFRKSSPPPRRHSPPSAPLRDLKQSAPSAIALEPLDLVPAQPVTSELSPPSAPRVRAERRSVPPAAPPKAGPLETGFAAKVERGPVEEKPLARRLGPALVLLGVALLVAIFDPLYAALTGEKLTILGLRPGVIGGLLLLVALALGGREVFRDS
jgi:serine/threonine-protein kinase